MQQNQQPQQMVQQQPQPAPPARASKKLAIINPETGTDVLADMERERKQPSGPKTSHAIDIRSPTGETIVSAPAAASNAGGGHDGAGAEDGSAASVAEPSSSEVDGQTPDAKGDGDGQRRRSTSVEVPSSSLVSEKCKPHLLF
jgi:hypothetical protein